MMIDPIKLEGGLLDCRAHFKPKAPAVAPLWSPPLSYDHNSRPVARTITRILVLVTKADR